MGIRNHGMGTMESAGLAILVEWGVEGIVIFWLILQLYFYYAPKA